VWNASSTDPLADGAPTCLGQTTGVCVVTRRGVRDALCVQRAASPTVTEVPLPPPHLAYGRALAYQALVQAGVALEERPPHGRRFASFRGLRNSKDRGPSTSEVCPPPRPQVCPPRRHTASLRLVLHLCQRLSAASVGGVRRSGTTGFAVCTVSPAGRENRAAVVSPTPPSRRADCKREVVAAACASPQTRRRRSSS
jgi:hypothetical protein